MDPRSAVGLSESGRRTHARCRLKANPPGAFEVQLSPGVKVVRRVAVHVLAASSVDDVTGRVADSDGDGMPSVRAMTAMVDEK